MIQVLLGLLLFAGGVQIASSSCFVGPDPSVAGVRMVKLSAVDLMPGAMPTGVALLIEPGVLHNGTVLLVNVWFMA